MSLHRGLRLASLGLALCLGGAPAAAEPKPKPKAAPEDAAALEKRMQDDVLEGSVVTIAESGDLVFFGGAITVPARRPSVEACGEWIVVPPSERPGKLAAIRKAVTDRAEADRYSAKDRFEALKKATEPMKRCEAIFKARCEETRARVALDLRKAALEDVRKSLGRMVDEKQKQAIANDLDLVLDQCPLQS
jgi:hypothetical protein